MMTPFGSAVAPEVKMISATSSRLIGTARRSGRRVRLSRLRASRSRAAATPARRPCPRTGGTSWPIEHQLRRDDAADAREKVGRRAVVDRHDDDAVEQAAPERDDPLGPVLAEEDDLVALAQAGGVQARGEPARRAADLVVAERAAAEPIVVHEEVAAGRGEIVEEVDERVAAHG